MKIAELSVDEAVGSILIHNIADAQGHKAFNKGHRLTGDDIGKLRDLGKLHVLAGVLEQGDVGENEAVNRIARVAAGANLALSAASGGRVNLYATSRGVLEIDLEALLAINSFEGVTLATRPAHSVVEPKKMVATVKTIGLALPESTLRAVEQVAREAGTLIRIRPLGTARVGVILTGSADARTRVEGTFLHAITSRVEELGASVISHEYVAHDPAAIAGAIERARAAHVTCVVLAGETSIMDVRDVTPEGIVRAGGIVELYGAPVEPGNLLLLAYVGDLPVIGAPGCVKSRDLNVVDMILPRLLAGERVRKRDVIALANGGLLI
jgi:molybdopterin biosynthesis enzyme